VDLGVAAGDWPALLVGLLGASASVGKRCIGVTVRLVDTAGHGRDAAVAGAVLRRLSAGDMVPAGWSGGGGRGRWWGTAAGEAERGTEGKQNFSKISLSTVFSNPTDSEGPEKRGVTMSHFK